jgi:hypothetical protein
MLADSDMRWSSVLGALCLTVLLLGSSGSPVFAEDRPGLGLVSSWPIDILGHTTLEATTGAARTQSMQAITNTVVTAERLDIVVNWQTGYRTSTGEIDPLRLNAQRDQDRYIARNAELQFAEWMNDPLLLVFEEDPTMELRLRSSSGFTFLPERDPEIVGIGPGSPDSVRAGNTEASPTFWYISEGPTSHVHGLGTLEVTGDFHLFVHDIEFHIDDGDHQWSRWTGTWEADPDLPVSEYERRVTTIKVTNGTLSSEYHDKWDLYSNSLSSTFDGVLRTPGATGRILKGHLEFIFTEDPMELTGTGHLRLDAETGPRPTSTQFRFLPEGDFQVEGATTVETMPPGPNGGSLAGFFLVLSLSGLIVVGIVTTGLSTLGYLPPPSPAIRRRHHELWKRRGRRAAEAHQWPQAAACFHKAVRAQRDDPVAWYEWAQSELEAGRPERALKVAAQAQHIPGIDPLDLLDLQALASWDQGDNAGFESFLDRLAQLDLTMARGLLKDLEIGPSELSPALRARLEKKEDVIDGYA